MYFLAGFLTENRQGGESWRTSVSGASLSPPTTSRTSRRGEELSAPLPAAGTVSPPRWLSGSRLRGGERRARRLPTFPKHNPREISTPGGRGGGGTGRGRERGRRFQPGSSSHTQRLPLIARGGGWTEGCSVYPEGCMSRGNGPPRSQIFKNPQAPPPAWPPPLGRSSAALQSAILRRREPGISHPRGLGVGVAAAPAPGAGRHPAVRSAAAGPGLRLGAAPPPGRRRPPAALLASRL